MIALPTRKRGRQTAEAVEQYEADVDQFCKQLIEISHTLPVTPESRSWCYILEGYGLNKGDFSKAQTLIGGLRKDGRIPVNIVASDSKRATDGSWSFTDDRNPEQFAEAVVADIAWSHLDYHPLSPHDYQDTYLEVVVEKGDIAKLFSKITQQYHVPVTPMRGWSDINSRHDLINRLKRHRDKRCVLLCATDLDPGGVRIADFLRENLAALEGATGWRPDDLEIVRFGLDADFVEANGLTWIENLETSSGGRLDDRRHHDHKKSYVQDYIAAYGVRKVELQAMMAHREAAYELVRNAITRHVSQYGIDAYHDDVEELRAQVRYALPAAVARTLATMEERE